MGLYDIRCLVLFQEIDLIWFYTREIVSRSRHDVASRRGDAQRCVTNKNGSAAPCTDLCRKQHGLLTG